MSQSQALLKGLPTETEIRKRTFGLIKRIGNLTMIVDSDTSRNNHNEYVERSTDLTKVPDADEVGYQHIHKSLIMAPTILTTTATSKADTVLTHSNIGSEASTTFRRFSESSADEFHRSDVSLKRPNDWNNKNMWRHEFMVNSNIPTTQHLKKSRGYCPSNHNQDDDEGGNFCCCYSIGSRRNRISDAIDIAIRVLLVYIFTTLEKTKPFQRKLHPEEIWLYKNPRTPDILSAQALLLSVTLGPFFVTLFQLWLTGDRRDFRAANWVWTLALGLNGLVTSILKITVRRHRPDFYYRCFPDEIEVLNNSTIPGEVIYNCTGDIRQISEARKSFPSGHASFAFVAFGFIAMLVGAKLLAFSTRGRGQSWRLCATVMPLIFAALIALRRTCDYHNHWEDVLTGSIIGLTIIYLIYRQYYPSLTSKNCHRPYLRTCWRIRESNIRLNSHSRIYERLSSKEDMNDGDEEIVPYENHGNSSRSEHRRLI
ncbi:phospholipid phosphatase 5-like [Eurosta solidaginis]|uniref:phospholipid phosphatase 5-like n=1 Tax=Eurosta solidaginis TaxID=178769 RepID=UPI0035314BA4